METLFSLANLVVLPFWALAILAPGWSWSERILRSVWIVAPPALLYAALILPNLPAILPLLLGSGGPQLSQIAAGLGTPEGATTAWTHVVAFDLFVGRWIYLDARASGVPWGLSSPVLFVVFLFGPLGLLIHLLLRLFIGARSSSA